MSRGTPADAGLLEYRARAEGGADAPPVPGVAVTVSALAGVPVLRCLPDRADPGRTLLWFHGGGYRLGSARGFRAWNSHLAAACATEVVSVDYRLAPEHPFPDALLDAVLAYSAIVPEHRRVVVGGESAGGGLAAALLRAIAERDLPAPAGAVLCSPWLDLRNVAASFAENAATDQLFPQASADAAAGLYLAGHPASDPLASPLLGDWSAQPPVLVQASSDESLRDDAVGLAQRCAGARLELYDGVPHAWHIGYPEAQGSVDAVESIARFVTEVTPEKAAHDA